MPIFTPPSSKNPFAVKRFLLSALLLAFSSVQLCVAGEVPEELIGRWVGTEKPYDSIRNYLTIDEKGVFVAYRFTNNHEMSMTYPWLKISGLLIRESDGVYGVEVSRYQRSGNFDPIGLSLGKQQHEKMKLSGDTLVFLGIEFKKSMPIPFKATAYIERTDSNRSKKARMVFSETGGYKQAIRSNNRPTGYLYDHVGIYFVSPGNEYEDLLHVLYCDDGKMNFSKPFYSYCQLRYGLFYNTLSGFEIQWITWSESKPVEMVGDYTNRPLVDYRYHYSLEMANYSGYGVIIKALTTDRGNALKSEFKLYPKDRAVKELRGGPKFKGYPKHLPKQAEIVWQLAELSNCSYEHGNTKSGCDWAPIEGKEFRQMIELDALKETEAFKKAGKKNESVAMSYFYPVVELIMSDNGESVEVSAGLAATNPWN